jgi:hypothetical protein
MVVYTLDSRFNSITLAGSKYFGAPITWPDVGPLLLGRDPAAERATAAAEPAAPKPAAAETTPTEHAAAADKPAAPIGANKPAAFPLAAGAAPHLLGPLVSIASTDSGRSSGGGAPVTVELVFRPAAPKAGGAAVGMQPLFAKAAPEPALKGAAAPALAPATPPAGGRPAAGKRVRWMAACAAAFEDWTHELEEAHGGGCDCAGGPAAAGLVQRRRVGFGC